MDVVGAEREIRVHFPLVARRPLIGIGDLAIGIVEIHLSRVPDWRAGREQLVEQNTIDDRSIREKRIGRLLRVRGSRIGTANRLRRRERIGQDGGGHDPGYQFEVRLVVEPAVAAAQQRAAVAVDVVSHADARRDIVPVDRILRRIGKRRVVGFQDGLGLDVVSEAEAEPRPVGHLPLVLKERRNVMRFLVPVQRTRHANRQALGIGARVQRIEEHVGAKREHAVRVVLGFRARAGKLVLGAKLQVVIAVMSRAEPRQRVGDLIRVVDAHLGHRALLVGERQILERRFQLILVMAVAVEAWVRQRHVLTREVGAQGVRPVAGQNRGQGSDDRLIDIALVARRGLRDRSDDLVQLRRRLAQPAEGPRVAGGQLMVDADQRVPDAIPRQRRCAQLGMRQDVDRARAIDLHPLDVEEEMRLVLHKRTAEVGIPSHVVRVGFGEVALRDEEVRPREARILNVERAAPGETVRALLGDRVDDGAGRAAELGVVLVRDHLQFLKPLERHPRLRSRALADHVVVVVGAVEHVVVVARIHAVHADGVRPE